MLDFGRLQGEDEVFSLLGCYAAKVDSFLPTFWSQLLSRNVGNKLPTDAVCNITEDQSPQQTFTLTNFFNNVGQPVNALPLICHMGYINAHNKISIFNSDLLSVAFIK
jgi:hypothetical protein